MNKEKHIVIIGSGPGGYHAAVLLSKENHKVTIIEKAGIGGTCLNVGCIPTKALLDHVSLFEHFRESVIKKKIFHGENLSINIERLKAFQSEVIKQLQQGLEKLLMKKQIKLIHGEAKLLAEGKIQVTYKDGNQVIFADEIIIATGSRQKSIPGFEFDGKLIVSSDHIWNIPAVPKNLLVIGSGPIGIEFARIYNLLGSTVTISEIKEKICPILDSEISENLVRSLKRRGINLKPNFATKFIEKKSDSVVVEFLSTEISEKIREEFDQVLISVGRESNTQNLGLAECKVELELPDYIKVDKFLKTNVHNIWAIGDVTKFPQLAHTASYQARTVAANICGNNGNNREFTGSVIPSCIFGYPEIAFVGKTEEELKDSNVSYKTGKYLFLSSGKAKASGLTEGIAKVLMDEKTKKIFGAHIIGAEASNLIHEIVIAMQNELTVEEVINSIHAHPTYSEVLLEALEDCLGEAIHV